jgi:biotin-(acetyl-CoA carboxylase) ligase
MPDMVGGSRHTCSCGWDIPPTDCVRSYLEEWRILHLAHHRGHAGPHTHQQWKEYALALKDAVDVLEKSRRAHRGRVCDLEEELCSVQFDLKVAYELADDLKADLAAEMEGRHA